MEKNETMQESKTENLRKWEISRRQLLKIIGLGGAAAATAPIIPGLLNRSTSEAATDDVEEQSTGHHGDAQAANMSDQRIRRWGMIIDLRKCDGCQGVDKPPQCTTACIEGHFVPEPMEWIEPYEHELQGGGTYFLPTLCMQCQNPPCVNVCPVGATWSTPEGVVLIDKNRCIGCRMCMAACPYERRFFTWAEPPVPHESLFVEYSPEHQIPMKRGVVYKCDFCPEMARAGRLPFCAQACPNNAIYYGDLEEDVATNGVEIVQFSEFLSEQSAFRHKEDLGTRPRVYYIPGHGQEAGRNPDTPGRKPTEWKWIEKLEGSKTWRRDGR